MKTESLAQHAQTAKNEASQEDAKLEHDREKQEVQAFCDVARAQGCGFIADLFETFAGLKGAYREEDVDKERRILRDQIKICENRLNKLK